MPTWLGEVGDPGGAAAVDAGDVAERVQLLGPGLEEGERGGGGAGGARVGLHVEVDRAARARSPTAPAWATASTAAATPCAVAWLALSLAQLLQALVGRLQPDVGRDQVPAGGGLGADPARGQVGLRAAAVVAADVDADRPVGRGGAQAAIDCARRAPCRRRSRGR